MSPEIIEDPLIKKGRKSKKNQVIEGEVAVEKEEISKDVSEDESFDESSEDREIEKLNKEIEQEVKNIEEINSVVLRGEEKDSHGIFSRFFDRAKEIKNKVSTIVSERSEGIATAFRERKIERLSIYYGAHSESIDEEKIYKKIEKIYGDVDTKKLSLYETQRVSKIALELAKKSSERFDWHHTLRWEKFIDSESYSAFVTNIEKSVIAKNPNAFMWEKVEDMSQLYGENPRLMMQFLYNQTTYSDYYYAPQKGKDMVEKKIIEIAERYKNDPLVVTNIPSQLFKNSDSFSFELKKEYLRVNKYIPSDYGYVFSDAFQSLDKNERKDIVGRVIGSWQSVSSSFTELMKFMRYIPLTREEYSYAIELMKENNKSDIEYINELEGKYEEKATSRFPIIRVTNWKALNLPPLNVEEVKGILHNRGEYVGEQLSNFKYISDHLEQCGLTKEDARKEIVNSVIYKVKDNGDLRGFEIFKELYTNQSISSEERALIFDAIFKSPDLSENINIEMGGYGWIGLGSDDVRKIYLESKENTDVYMRQMAEKLFCLCGTAHDLRHYLSEIIQGTAECFDMESFIHGYTRKEGNNICNEFIEMFLKRDTLDKKYMKYFVRELKMGIPPSLGFTLDTLKEENYEKYTNVLNEIENHGNVDLVLSAFLKGYVPHPKKETMERVVQESFKNTDTINMILREKLIDFDRVFEIVLHADLSSAEKIFSSNYWWEYSYLSDEEKKHAELLLKKMLEKCEEQKDPIQSIHLLSYVNVIKNEPEVANKFIDKTIKMIENSRDVSLNIKLLEESENFRYVFNAGISDSFLKDTISLARESKKFEHKESFLHFFFKHRNDVSYNPETDIETRKFPYLEKARGDVRNIFEDVMRNDKNDLNSVFSHFQWNLYEDNEKIPQDVFTRVVDEFVRRGFHLGSTHERNEECVEYFETKYKGVAEILNKRKNPWYFEKDVELEKNERVMFDFMHGLSLSDIAWAKENGFLDKEKILPMMRDISLSKRPFLIQGLEKQFIPWLARDVDLLKDFGDEMFEMRFHDDARYTFQKSFSNIMSSEKLFGGIKKYEGAQIKSIAAGELISSWFSSDEKIEKVCIDAEPKARDSIKVIQEFIAEHKTKKSNFGLTITALLGAREYTSELSRDAFLVSVGDALLSYKKYISAWDAKKVPEKIRATIGMEYEVTGSLRDEYTKLTGRGIATDLNELNNFARIGKGNDAVYEIATQVADNPYLVLLQMQLLEDIGFLDFNFKKEGYEKGARGMHVTIGGESGLRQNKNTHFLHNMLIASNWGGVNVGKDVSGASRGRSYPLRERSHTETPAVEMRSLSIDKKEPFERAMLTAHLGAIAIQAVEKYTKIDPESLDIISFPKNEDEFKNFLKEKSLLKEDVGDPKILSVVFAWCKMVCDIRASIVSHNSEFLERETAGYLDENGNWVDVAEFGGKDNKTRFESIIKKSGMPIEEYLKKVTTLNPEKVFWEADKELINTYTAIANLFIKPSSEMGGDQANASAVLATTKVGGKIENDSFQNVETFSFEKRDIDRRGYYSFQGGSKEMIIHAIQNALLTFKSRMEQSLTFQ